jgi:hypothetical protein
MTHQKLERKSDGTTPEQTCHVLHVDNNLT